MSHDLHRRPFSKIARSYKSRSLFEEDVFARPRRRRVMGACFRRGHCDVFRWSMYWLNIAETLVPRAAARRLAFSMMALSALRVSLGISSFQYVFDTNNYAYRSGLGQALADRGSIG